MVLLLGSGGYVGSRFVDFFHYKKINFLTLSIREKKDPENILRTFIKSFKPTHVVNCIGFTGRPNVDSCESYKEQTMHCNVTLASIVAKVCKDLNTPLGFVSSGCIYDNTLGDPERVYTEEDLPNFCFSSNRCSWYSGTKELGESVVYDIWGEKTHIWRLRIPFNHVPSDKNYVYKIMNYERVWSFPNSITNIDEFVATCYYSLVKETPYGIYNIVNPEPIEAREILEMAKFYGVTNKEFEYFSNAKEFEKNTKTPRSNCVLSCEKIMNEGFGLLTSKESVEKSLNSWNKKEKEIFW